MRTIYICKGYSMWLDCVQNQPFALSQGTHLPMNRNLRVMIICYQTITPRELYFMLSHSFNICGKMMPVAANMLWFTILHIRYAVY